MYYAGQEQGAVREKKVRGIERVAKDEGRGVKQEEEERELFTTFLPLAWVEGAANHRKKSIFTIR